MTIDKQKFEEIIKSFDSGATFSGFYKSSARATLTVSGKKLRIEGSSVAAGYYCNYKNAEKIVNIRIIGAGSNYALYTSLCKALSL